MLLEFQTLFPGLTNIMGLVYRGWAGGGGGWVAVGWFFHTFEQKSSQCVY